MTNNETNRPLSNDANRNQGIPSEAQTARGVGAAVPDAGSTAAEGTAQRAARVFQHGPEVDNRDQAGASAQTSYTVGQEQGGNAARPGRRWSRNHASGAARADKEGKKKRTVKQEILSWIGLLLAAVAIATVVRALLIEPIKVDGRSMLETLQDGEIVLVTKPKMLLGRLERGDVVICRFPTREKEYSLPIGASLDISVTNHTLFVKRLVALPGDAVAVLGGVLYVNDARVEEPYVAYPSRADYPRRVLGNNEYMVMGDNRANSHDSRSSDVGPLTKDMIVGRAAFVLFPFSRFGAVQ